MRTARTTLHSVAFNTVPASGSVTIADNASGTGSGVIAVVATQAATDHLPFTLFFDVECQNGLSITVGAGTWDMTVSAT